MTACALMAQKAFLDALYEEYNRPERAARDPVWFLHGYADPLEREVVGLIAALLARGRVEQIVRSVEDALRRLGGAPRRFVVSGSTADLRAACDGFTHRMVNGERLRRFLQAVKQVLAEHGSLQQCFLSHDDASAPTILPGLTGLATELIGAGAPVQLVADPSKGSACKRWNLYLRWVVRRDAIDPGGWGGVRPARLIVPLDTHMWRVCRELGLTDRKLCNLSAALEVTDSFRRICPDDPVRYDFALMHASLEGRLGPGPLPAGGRDAGLGASA